MLSRWPHKPECTDTECYCADDNDPDPVCDCGRPGWACACCEECGSTQTRDGYCYYCEDADYDEDEDNGQDQTEEMEMCEVRERSSGTEPAPQR